MMQWSQVRPKIDREIEEIKAALIDAPADEVLRLQIRARVLQDVRSWFEEETPRDRSVSHSPKY